MPSYAASVCLCVTTHKTEQLFPTYTADNKRWSIKHLYKTVHQDSLNTTQIHLRVLYDNYRFYQAPLSKHGHDIQYILQEDDCCGKQADNSLVKFKKALLMSAHNEKQHVTFK